MLGRELGFLEIVSADKPHRVMGMTIVVHPELLWGDADAGACCLRFTYRSINSAVPQPLPVRAKSFLSMGTGSRISDATSFEFIEKRSIRFGMRPEVWIVPLRASAAHTDAANMATPGHVGRIDRRGLRPAPDVLV